MQPKLEYPRPENSAMTQFNVTKKIEQIITYCGIFPHPQAVSQDVCPNLMETVVTVTGLLFLLPGLMPSYFL